MIYAFMTWVVANLIHPIILILYTEIIGGGLMASELAEAYVFLLVLSLIFSIPSLVISCMAIYIPLKLPIIPDYKYLLWILIAFAIPLLNLFILKLIQSDLFDEFGYGFALPASGAVLLSVFLRYNAFMKFLNEPAETTIGNE